MSEMNGGELIARCLANEGVKFLIGLPCPDVDPLLAKLDEFGIRLVPVRHEAAAVHIAEGIYKTTGTVAAVFGNPGPGSSNLLPGVLTALHEGVPVLVITAQHRPGIVSPSSPVTFQGQDQLNVFRPAVKWGGSVAVWERIPELFRMAFREMWNGRPGPVHLDIHNTVVYADGDRGESADLSGVDGTREPAAGITAADPRGGGPARRGEASGHHLRQWCRSRRGGPAGA